MTTSSHLRTLLIVFATLHLALLASAQAFGRSEYRAGEITIEKIEKQKDGSLRISYQSMPESMYYSPGVNAKTTKRGLELTFVRSHFKKKPKADFLAKPLREGPVLKTVTIPTKGLEVFMKSGGALVQIHPQPEAE